MGPELLHDDGKPSNGRYDPRATDVWAAGALIPTSITVSYTLTDVWAAGADPLPEPASVG